MRKKGEIIKVTVNEDRRESDNVMLENQGYKHTGYNEKIKGVVYEKDGKSYRFVDWEQSDGYVYNVTLKEITGNEKNS